MPRVTLCQIGGKIVTDKAQIDLRHLDIGMVRLSPPRKYFFFPSFPYRKEVPAYRRSPRHLLSFMIKAKSILIADLYFSMIIIFTFFIDLFTVRAARGFPFPAAGAACGI